MEPLSKSNSNSRLLHGKTIIITGSSRGIGAALAYRCAKDGANVVITGKTVEPHPKLPGTIYSVAEQVNKLGGKALALQLDVREQQQIDAVVAATVEQFGGIDILVNNASAINLASTMQTEPKRLDLMLDVNLRATFLCSRAALPYLVKAQNPHILTFSPPLAMQPKWFKDHAAYTISKYGMSMCTLGMAAEFKEQGVAVNSLWPRTTIATAAIANNFTPEILQASRTAEIMADAAYLILCKNSRSCTGNFFIDESLLRAAGVVNFARYAVSNTGAQLFLDLFIDE